MKLAALGSRLAGTVILASSALAGGVIWLLLTDPVALTRAVASGTVGPLVRALLDVFGQVCRGMLRWL